VIGAAVKQYAGSLTMRTRKFTIGFGEAIKDGDRGRPNVHIDLHSYVVSNDDFGRLRGEGLFLKHTTAIARCEPGTDEAAPIQTFPCPACDQPVTVDSKACPSCQDKISFAEGMQAWKKAIRKDDHNDPAILGETEGTDVGAGRIPLLALMPWVLIAVSAALLFLVAATT
jgi:hypothetical protein